MNEEIKLLNKEKRIKELEKILLEKEYFYENTLLNLKNEKKLKEIDMNHEYNVLKITIENEKNNLQKELEIEKEKSSINNEININNLQKKNFELEMKIREIDEFYRHRLKEISLEKNQEIEILKIEKKLQGVQNEFEKDELIYLIEKKKKWNMNGN